ncbi:MAG: radical SAM protein [Candidatus Thermoplasmatota archaeon]|nr:radical SAM protein [Candidatus Thermoplasmatota archaeon]
MNILEEYGNDVLAKVFVASFGDDEKMVEFVESTQPPFTWKEKWVLIVSPLFGCPIGCQMCDAGGGYGGRLTKDQLLAQIDHLVKRRYPDGIIPVPKFKIQFARMGEPALNPAVLEVLRELPVRYDAPGLIPSISTVAPQGSDRFFSGLKKVKDQLYQRGKFQLQFSIHSSVEAERDMIIPCKKWSMEKISEYGNDFYEPGDRKITLNFAVIAGRTIETAMIRKIFNPEKFLIKLTPLNPTIRGEEGGLGSGFDPERPETAEGLVKGFEKQGFDVILSIGELEENNIGSNCGQYVQRMRLRQEAMK